MRTVTDINFDFAKKTLAYTTEEVFPVNINDILRVYIPLIMSGISMGSPTQWTEGAGNGIFKNAAKCKPHASNTVTAKNYVNAKKEDNVSLTRYEKRYGKIAKVPEFQKLQCTFTHGKLKNCTFTTDTFTD